MKYRKLYREKTGHFYRTIMGNSPFLCKCNRLIRTTPSLYFQAKSLRTCRLHVRCFYMDLQTKGCRKSWIRDAKNPSITIWRVYSRSPRSIFLPLQNQNPKSSRSTWLHVSASNERHTSVKNLFFSCNSIMWICPCGKRWEIKSAGCLHVNLVYHNLFQDFF